MFPFVQFSKRPWFGPGVLMASLVLLSLNPPLLDCVPQGETVARTTASIDDVTYINDMESHLKSKAGVVLERFTSEEFTIDLSLELDTVQTTTTTYLPGQKILVQNQEKQETLGSQTLQPALGPNGEIIKDPNTMQPIMEVPRTSDDSNRLLPGDGKGSYNHCVRSQKWELTGTWTESTDVRPKIKTIRCCVTLAKGERIDQDDLYRCLSYSLGINLERGDLLQIVER